jgi:hypothetical protein
MRKGLIVYCFADLHLEILTTLSFFIHRFYCPSATRASGDGSLLSEYVDEMVNADSSGSKKRKLSEHKPGTRMIVCIRCVTHLTFCHCSQRWVVEFLQLVLLEIS